MFTNAAITGDIDAVLPIDHASRVDTVVKRTLRICCVHYFFGGVVTSVPKRKVLLFLFLFLSYKMLHKHQKYSFQIAGKSCQQLEILFKVKT